MMNPNKIVELIRLPKKEKLYEREEVLGRNLLSIFPEQAKKSKTSTLSETGDNLPEKSRFITESELKNYHINVREDSSEGKSLAMALAENKLKKDEAFKERWKIMKQGKNRPLDDDEYNFLTNLAEKAKSEMKKKKNESEVEEFIKGRDAYVEESILRSNDTASTAILPPVSKISNVPKIRVKKKVKGSYKGL